MRAVAPYSAIFLPSSTISNSVTQRRRRDMAFLCTWNSTQLYTTAHEETLPAGWTDFPLLDGQRGDRPGAARGDLRRRSDRAAHTFSVHTIQRPLGDAGGTHAYDGFCCQTARRLPK